MLVEATLDFPEEEIDFLEQANARGRLAEIAAQLARVQERARQGALLREGLRVVIAGQPNVGKSSLLNALAGAELAIVTPIAGTTRDKVTGEVQIEGVPVHVIDTAGLRESDDEVERIGISRSWDAIDAADAVLWLHDLTRAGDADHAAADAAIERRLPAALLRSDRLVHVFNKADAVPPEPAPGRQLRVSAHTGTGIDALRRRLLQLAGWQAEPRRRLHRSKSAPRSAAPQRAAPDAGVGNRRWPGRCARTARRGTPPRPRRAGRDHRRVRCR